MAEPALMNDLETDEIEGRCCHCGRILPAGLWFARIQRHGRLLEFCRPRCVEQFFGATEAVPEGSEHSYNEAGFLAAAV
jgi:hypothetical protein